MFKPCPHTSRKTCSFASKSNYDPDKRGVGSQSVIFCGIATGSDNRVLKMHTCWKNMSASAKKKHRDGFNWDAYR